MSRPGPFERFFEANRVPVMRLLVAALGPHDAEDAFQETFLAALRAWPKVRDDGRLDRWVLRIASRKAIDHHRAAATRPVPGDLPETKGGGEHMPEPEDPRILAAVSALPPKQRVAVALRAVFGWPYPDIAEVLGSSVEAARANVSEGLKKLRGAMS